MIDARTLILDSLDGYLTDAAAAEAFVNDRGVNMIVTSTEIDQVIRDFSDIIADAINITVHPGIYS